MRATRPRRTVSQSSRGMKSCRSSGMLRIAASSRASKRPIISAKAASLMESVMSMKIPAAPARRSGVSRELKVTDESEAVGGGPGAACGAGPAASPAPSDETPSSASSSTSGSPVSSAELAPSLASPPPNALAAISASWTGSFRGLPGSMPPASSPWPQPPSSHVAAPPRMGHVRPAPSPSSEWLLSQSSPIARTASSAISPQNAWRSSSMTWDHVARMSPRPNMSASAPATESQNCVCVVPSNLASSTQWE
mmetsp:Transcript_31120/g.88901  ORF Transcript_31120/g.88901 Transcript_31120/m.88901 type:complete len:252 (-) Transcript_31120:482-1237(-)